MPFNSSFIGHPTAWPPVRCQLLACHHINCTLKTDWSGVKLQVMSTLIGVVYFGQQLNQDGVMNINGALFIFLTNMTFQNVFAVISVSRIRNGQRLLWPFGMIRFSNFVFNLWTFCPPGSPIAMYSTDTFFLQFWTADPSTILYTSLVTPAWKTETAEVLQTKCRQNIYCRWTKYFRVLFGAFFNVGTNF